MTGTYAESFTDGGAAEDAQVPQVQAAGDQGPTQEEILEMLVISRLASELEQFEDALLTKLSDQLDSMHDMVNRELQSRQDGMTRQEAEAFLEDRLEELRGMVTGELQARQEGMSLPAVEGLLNERLDGQTAFLMEKIVDAGRSRDSELILSEPFREKVREAARLEAESMTSIKAVEVADGIARSAAKIMPDPGLESIAGEFEAKLEQLKHQAFGRARWYAVFAAIIGMASAAVVHYLGF